MNEKNWVTSGDFPPVLYRRYADEKWALNFINNGSFQMKSLYYYRTLKEEERKDPREGLTDVGGFNVGPPTFIFCCYYNEESDNQEFNKKFGAFRFRIIDPRQFGQDITDFLVSNFEALRVSNAVCYKVEYYDNLIPYSSSVDMTDLRRWSARKPAKFRGESEYRYVCYGYNGYRERPLALGSQRDQIKIKYVESININLNKRLDYIKQA